MPCPYFEPLQIVLSPARANARLPLIGEFTGSCHASGEAIPAPRELLFQACNQGYSRGSCSHYPAADSRSSLRYSITGQASGVLDLMCIEETDYTPVQWYPLRYVVSDGSVLPATANLLVRAQAAAFCREYMRRMAPE